MSLNSNISIIIPAKNEADGLSAMLPDLKELHPKAEIIVINDGSEDNTVEICEQHKVKCLSHPYSKGNGASIKTGARNASNDIIVFMDGDGQHKSKDITRLLDKYSMGFDLVVGARSNASQATVFRRIANNIYNKLASLMTGYKIEDLTSGFRVVNRNKFLKFLYLLPNGFSYPTTSTMAFFRSGYSVAYVPIEADKRRGESHIRLIRDGVRFFTIILKVGALFSPMRLFLPISTLFFLSGLIYYFYTFITTGRFTNMVALLFIASLFTFLMGIISEQISSLHYRHMDEPEE